MILATGRGYSLIELLTVLAIIAVLFSFGSTAWRQTLIATRRSDATTALQRIAARQELFRLQNLRYADSNELAQTPPDGLGITATTSAHYSLVTRLTDSGFTATATALSASTQQDDWLCKLFSIDESGRRKATTDSGSDSTRQCWKS
jgi:type IV pilus assembly protein PilE